MRFFSAPLYSSPLFKSYARHAIEHTRWAVQEAESLRNDVVERVGIQRVDPYGHSFRATRLGIADSRANQSALQPIPAIRLDDVATAEDPVTVVTVNVARCHGN